MTPNGITIFENPTVLPRFRFVQRIRPAQDLDDALSWMNRPDFDPAEEAVVEGVTGTDLQMASGSILGEKLEADSTSNGKLKHPAAASSWLQIHFSLVGPLRLTGNPHLSTLSMDVSGGSRSKPPGSTALRCVSLRQDWPRVLRAPAPAFCSCVCCGWAIEPGT